VEKLAIATWQALPTPSASRCSLSALLSRPHGADPSAQPRASGAASGLTGQTAASGRGEASKVRVSPVDGPEGPADGVARKGHDARSRRATPTRSLLTLGPPVIRRRRGSARGVLQWASVGIQSFCELRATDDDRRSPPGFRWFGGDVVGAYRKLVGNPLQPRRLIRTVTHKEKPAIYAAGEGAGESERSCVPLLPRRSLPEL
jgi:hypothetical protein